MTEKTNKKTFPNLYTGTFIAVIALHAITGWALASVKTPEVAITEPVKAPPLEIEIIEPIIEESEVVEVQPQPEPVPEPKSEPVSTVAPQYKAKPEPKPKSKKPLKTQQTQQEVQDKKPVDHQAILKKQQQARVNAQKQAELKAQENARLQEQERARANAQEQERLETQEQARLNAQEEARIKAEEDKRKAAAQAAAERARVAQEAAQAKAAADAAAAAQMASNKPVRFSGSDASWAREPNFEGLTKKALTLTLNFRVDKQGNISNITVKGSNDREIVLEVKRRLGRSKLNPFMKNGVPVIGIVNLPFAVTS